MKLENDAQLARTRELLQEVEQLFEEQKRNLDPNPHIQESTLRALADTIKDFKEQIAIYLAPDGGVKSSCY